VSARLHVDDFAEQTAVDEAPVDRATSGIASEPTSATASGTTSDEPSEPADV
jgi:hypothetical protein